MQECDPVEMHMQMLAHFIVAEACRWDANPLELDVSVEQGPRMWHIRRGKPSRWNSMPSGTGQLAWDTTRYPDVTTALRAALQREMAGDA